MSPLLIDSPTWVVSSVPVPSSKITWSGLALISQSEFPIFSIVTVISTISDYHKLAEELKIYRGSTSMKFRKYMSAKAFSVTAYYDSVVSSWLNNQLNIKFPEKKTVHGKLI